MSQVSAERGGEVERGSVAALYRATRKRDDMAFNTYVCRPLAAVVVYVLRPTRVAPNQVTFFSLLLAVVAAALLILLEWPLGLWLGVAVYELSYVFDKVDGMLARSRGVQSPTGHLLDFLMDEIKAFLTLAAVATGAYLATSRVDLLLWGLAGVVCLASGIGMTTFQRRPEVLAARGAGALKVAESAGDGADSAEEGVEARGTARPSAALPAPRSLSSSAIKRAEAVGRFFIHYPSYIWLAAVLSDARVYLYPYVVVNALYAARSLLGLGLRYGGWAARA